MLGTAEPHPHVSAERTAERAYTTDYEKEIYQGKPKPSGAYAHCLFSLKATRCLYYTSFAGVD